MKKNIFITREEYAKLIDYLKLMDENPCSLQCDIPDISSCCGCRKQRDWSKRRVNIEADIKDLLSESNIVTYAETAIEREKLQKEIEILRSKLATLEDKLHSFGCIVEPDHE